MTDKDGVTCDACGKGFTAKEWKDRHDGHEYGCGYNETGSCECTLVYHAKCCPECERIKQDGCCVGF